MNYGEAVETIQESIRCGVNYLDTSPWYGNSEAIIGEALKNVPREAYYIGTKVGRYFTPTWENRFDFSGQAVLKSVEKSLQLLGLEYVDIIQVNTTTLSCVACKIYFVNFPVTLMTHLKLRHLNDCIV